jgi:hypothetical protein
MNEISILMHLLSRKRDNSTIGATRKEILDNLNLKTKNNDIYLQRLFIGLSDYIKPLGLLVKFNPINQHWYIIFESEISDHIIANPFGSRPSLAATLFCIITCGIKSSGIARIEDIKKMRKKKDLSQDLKELVQFGYIIVDKGLNRVTLTSLLGYQLDFYKLFMNLALKVKEEE